MSEDGAKEVVDTFQNGLGNGAISVDGNQVVAWMDSDDLDIRSTLYSYLSEDAQRRRIYPEISDKTYFQFSTHLFGECLQQNADNMWALSRYEAEWEIVRFFFKQWDGQPDSVFTKKFKEWLEKVYMSGDPEVRECLVNATLEHLFENKIVAKAFSSWKHDWEFCGAYADAMLWVKKGGRQPSLKEIAQGEFPFVGESSVTRSWLLAEATSVHASLRSIRVEGSCTSSLRPTQFRCHRGNAYGHRLL